MQDFYESQLFKPAAEAEGGPRVDIACTGCGSVHAKDVPEHRSADKIRNAGACRHCFGRKFQSRPAKRRGVLGN